MKKNMALLLTAAMVMTTAGTITASAAGDAGKVTVYMPSPAGLADELALVGRHIAGVAAEDAGRVVLLQHDPVILHEDFDHVLHADIHGPAQLDGQNDTAEAIKLANNAGRLHCHSVLLIW